MTDHREHLDSSTNDLPDELVAAMSHADRLRAIADDEHTTENLTDDDRSRIAFEKELRARVSRAMGAVDAPAGLRARVQEALRQETGIGSGVIRPRHADTRSQSFWQRYAGVFSAAAVIALCAALVGLSIVRSQPNAQQVAGLPIAQIAPFVHTQHEACDPTADSSMAKFHARSKSDVAAFSTGHLGETPPVFHDRLEALDEIGFRFAGVGACRIPGKGPSVHAIYVRSDSPNPEYSCQKVSLFVQVDSGECTLDTSKCILTRCAITKQQSLAVWRQDGFIYFLYCPDEPTRDAAQHAFGAPDTIFEYTPS